MNNSTKSDLIDINCPKEYKNGWAEFYGFKFIVTPDVLIPRIETEKIIDEIVNYTSTNKNPEILEVGTGSGCIAVSLAKQLPFATITATDISDGALTVAKRNAKFHKVMDRITFIKDDLISTIAGTYDIVVANLPYIPTNRIPTLDASVKDYEPITALDGGKDGFDLYRKLFKQIKDKEILFKFFIGEIDETQGKIAKKEAQTVFPEADVDIIKDLFGYDRFITVKTEKIRAI